MMREACLLGALALTACAHKLPTDHGLPPLVRISHEGVMVSHSDPKEREERAIECPYGAQRRGDVFPVAGGFPAVFEADFVDRWGLREASVIVFGGSITEAPRGWSVSMKVVDGQYAEVATRDFNGLGRGLGVKDLRFGAMPVTGSNSGQSTIKMTATATDRKGRIARTTTPVLATPGVLCGSYS